MPVRLAYADPPYPGQSAQWYAKHPRQLRREAAGYVWDSLRCPSHVFGRSPDRITGSKPPRFCRWIFELLGAKASDTLDDIFPGSGVVGREWNTWCAQTRLAV